MNCHLTLTFRAGFAWLQHVQSVGLDRIQILSALQVAMHSKLLEVLLPCICDKAAEELIARLKDDAITDYTVRECPQWEFVEQSATFEICAAVQELFNARGFEHTFERISEMIAELSVSCPENFADPNERIDLGSIETELSWDSLKGYVSIGRCEFQLGEREVPLEEPLGLHWQASIPQYLAVNCELDYLPPENDGFLIECDGI